jgi:hypothetical protein
MENKKWTREEAEQNKNNLLDELKDFPTSKENLEWVAKELNQLIDEEEVRQITSNNKNAVVKLNER